MLGFAVISVMIAVTTASNDYHSIELPVNSKHDLEVIRSPSEETDHETHVEVPGGVLPIYLTFNSQSSPIYVKQEHKHTKGSYQKSDSEDEPHKLVHEVVKPVFHELKEVLTPYRKVIQVIEPVKEEQLTKVHKGEGKSMEYTHDNYGSYQSEYKDSKYEDQSSESQMKKVTLAQLKSDLNRLFPGVLGLLYPRRTEIPVPNDTNDNNHDENHEPIKPEVYTDRYEGITLG